MMLMTPRRRTLMEFVCEETRIFPKVENFSRNFWRRKWSELETTWPTADSLWKVSARLTRPTTAT